MAASDESSTWESTEGISAYFVLFSALLALVLVLSKILHDRPVLSNFFPEAGMILLVGMIAGFFVNLFVRPEVVVAPDEGAENDDGAAVYDDSVAQSLLSFSPEVFFVALLPPIIFNSGYHLRRELFFRHIVPISLFAILGTLISAFCISFLLELVKGFGLMGDFEPRFTELLTFGALISATDPVSTLAVFQTKRVDPHLFYLVFGESVLNDAVGLVLFDAFSKFVVRDNGAGKVVIGVGEFIFGFLYDAIGSPVLGLLFGCGAALLFKHVDMRSNRLLELSVYMLIMYVPFLLAELMMMSGIVTILFTGMTARAYIVPNLSPETCDNAEILFRLFAHLAETSIFLELGLSVFGMRGSFQGLFILWSLVACLVGRALNIYPLSFLFNQRLKMLPKSASEKAADQRRKLRDQYSAANKNESHVEMRAMTDNLATSDHHGRQQESNDTSIKPGLMRQNSNGTMQSAQTLTPNVRRDLKISWKTANMLSFSGLRGAVAYACSRSFPDTFLNQSEMVVTTMAIVLFTVFVLGGTTSVMLELLDIEVDVDESRYMEDWHQERQSANILLKLDYIIRRNVVRREEAVHDPISTNDSSHDGGTSPVRPPPSSMQDENGIESEAGHFHTMEVPVSSSTTTTTTPRSTGRRDSSLFDFGKN